MRFRLLFVLYVLVLMLHVRALSTRNWLKKSYLALDFDGVICASSSESSVTALIAAEEHWGRRVMQCDDVEAAEVTAALVKLRPIIETGYENMLLARLLLEEYRKYKKVDVDTLFRRWGNHFRDDLLKQYSAKSDILIQAFGESRDRLIQKDLKKWVGLNPIFPFIKDFLENNSLNTPSCSIITTKQARFVETILKSNNIQPPARDRLFDLENPYGNKGNVLKELLRRSADSGEDAVIHFVEDRFDTLINVCKVSELDQVQLYLVDWGYNTEEQRNEAKGHKRIKLIDPEHFIELLQSHL